MADTQLFQPLGNQGVRWVHYFNGRLVSAEDQLAEQRAHGQEREFLGEAIGEGVVNGLEVVQSTTSTPASPTVTITRGLAINRSGDALGLADDTTVALVRPPEAGDAASAGFGACSPVTPGVYITGAGIYLLTIAPAAGTEGRAPVANPGNGAVPCNARYRVDTVQFRLIAVPLSALGLQNSDLSSPTLRNRIAHACFGTSQLVGNRFRPPAQGYGALDQLRSSGRLTDCDVPLALLYWTGNGIQFIDRWAVRRRTVADAWPAREALESGVLPVRWSLLLGDRRLGEAEAMFLQFAEQITPAQVKVKASQNYRHLPPAGLLPLDGSPHAWQTFFAGMTPHGPTVADVAFLRLLIHNSLHVEPIDVANPPPINVYTFPEIGDHVLYVRGDRHIPVEEEQEPEPPVQQEPGTFVVTVRDGSGAPMSENEVESVWAESLATGRQFPGKQIAATLNQNFPGLFGTVAASAAYIIPNVPPGKYLVKATPAGFHNRFKAWLFHVGSESATMLPGREVAVTVRLYEYDLDRDVFYMEREKVPPIVIDNREIIDQLGQRYQKIVVLHPDLVEKELPWEDPGFIDPAPDLQEEIAGGLRGWLDQDPELPITSEDTRIAIMPGYHPDSVTEEPYAYVVTGGGVMPAILVPVDQALVGSVPASRSNVPELAEPQILTRLDQVGLGEMDVLAAAWTGIVSGVSGTTPAVAKSLITDVMEQIPEARETLAHHTGLDHAAGLKLRDAGFDDVRIANASVEDIQAVIGADYSAGFVSRLRDRSRSIVGDAAWSLEGGRLGFTDEQVGLLADEGITTRGKLLDAIKEGTLADEQLEKLNLKGNQAEIDRITSAIATDQTATRLQLVPDAQLSSVPSITEEMGAQLAREGLTSPTQVAAAAPETLATTLGVSTDEALQITRDALATTLTRTSGVSHADALSIIETTGATTLESLASTDVAAVEPPAGITRERFNSVIGESQVLNRLLH